MRLLLESALRLHGKFGGHVCGILSSNSQMVVKAGCRGKLEVVDRFSKNDRGAGCKSLARSRCWRTRLVVVLIWDLWASGIRH